MEEGTNLKLEVVDLLPLLEAQERELLQLRVAVNALRRRLAETEAEVARYRDDEDEKDS